jgi:hypothetical protein
MQSTVHHRGFWEGFTVSAGDRIKNQTRATNRWRENNKERYRATTAAYSKKWSEENREKRREIGRRYYKKNREKLLEKKKEWQQKNKDKLAAASRAFYNRKKAISELPRCMSCESILKEEMVIYCSWCIKTYNPQTV